MEIQDDPAPFLLLASSASARVYGGSWGCPVSRPSGGGFRGFTPHGWIVQTFEYHGTLDPGVGLGENQSSGRRAEFLTTRKGVK
jgi:hypothetical protein